MLFANICVVSADVSSDPGVQTSWWTGYCHRLAQNYDGVSIMDVPYGTVLATIAADLCKAVCDISSDKWHHADEHDYIKVSEGKDGTYAVRAKCKYCHKEFVASGLTADSLSDAYTDYVSTLPAQGYDSAGTLLWQPRWVEDSSLYEIYATYGGTTVIGDSKGGGTYQSKVTRTDSEDKEHVVFRNRYDGTSFNISISDPVSTCSFCIYTRYNRYRVPITGTYTSIGSDCVTGSYLDAKTGKSAAVQIKWKTSSPRALTAGGQFANLYAQLSNTSSAIFSASTPSGSFKYSTPIFSVVPYEPENYSPTYTINTRVNNFNGDYYDSVTNNYYNNTTIINETTNNYYDMTTNTTYVMQKWSYDYQSRTYFITLEDGTTVTVQFGDDCMTITNNNVTNSYQYVIKNTPSTPDTPTTCKHEWTETIDTAPTCLESGHASYTCSPCGETYEQILAAKGHDWKVIEHVNMVYNSDGTVATQGHTLYQCSVCGEQWYTDTGAPPLDVSGSSSILAWLQSFQTWLDEKLDLTPVLERLDAILAQLQDTSGSATCDHTYQQHMEQEADCTLPGLQISACSQCGDSYSEIIDPLGHDWVISSHVDAVTEPDTGEETASAYDVYTCSRCGKTYEDHTGDGAPDEDYSSSSISQLVVKVFSKLGTFAGKLIGFIVRLFDKAISSVDEVISKFNEYTEQISGFGSDYPAWLTGFWAVLPSELQVALTFAVVCMVLGIVGKKLFFS